MRARADAWVSGENPAGAPAAARGTFVATAAVAAMPRNLRLARRFMAEHLPLPSTPPLALRLGQRRRARTGFDVTAPARCLRSAGRARAPSWRGPRAPRCG